MMMILIIMLIIAGDNISKYVMLLWLWSEAGRLLRQY